MDIASATATATATAAQRQQPEKGVISSDFETFLTMLTVQMQNQDPLNPIKSEDFAVQLATFSGVEQQVRTNDLIEALGAQMAVTGMSQIAGWVGMEARAAVPAHFDGTPITVVPQPEVTADQAVLVVRNANGIEVQRQPIPASGGPMDWTGLLDGGIALPNGPYDFSVESYANGALSSTRPVEVYTRITEARIDGGETVLVTEAGGEVAATSVTGLREPAA